MILARDLVLSRLNDIRDEDDETDYASFTEEELMEAYCLSGLFSSFHPELYEDDLKGIR